MFIPVEVWLNVMSFLGPEDSFCLSRVLNLSKEMRKFAIEIGLDRLSKLGWIEGLRLFDEDVKRAVANSSTYCITIEKKAGDLINDERVILEWSAYAMDDASVMCHLPVLEWWLKSGLQIKYSWRSFAGIAPITPLGYVPIPTMKKSATSSEQKDEKSSAVPWWQRRNAKPVYAELKDWRQYEESYLPILKWWRGTGLELKTGYYTLAVYSQKGMDRILDWWNEQMSDREIAANLAYGDEPVDMASASGMEHILEWWHKASDLDFCYSEKAINNASKNGHVHILDWWKNAWTTSKEQAEAKAKLKQEKSADAPNDDCNDDEEDTIQIINLLYDEGAINEASANGHVHVLDWWLSSNLEMRYDKRAMTEASMNGHIQVLDWWKENANPETLPLKFDDVKVIKAALDSNQIPILHWWLDSRLHIVIEPQSFGNSEDYVRWIEIEDNWFESKLKSPLSLGGSRSNSTGSINSMKRSMSNSSMERKRRRSKAVIKHGIYVDFYSRW